MFPWLGYGIGLRPPHYDAVLDGNSHVGWLEVITENFLGSGGNPRRVLRAVREKHAVALHGVSMSIGSVDPLDDRYLTALAALVDEIEPAVVSDHLCWSSIDGQTVHDLLPLPYTEEALAHVVARVQRVQDRLARRILLENPSTYIAFISSTIPEAEFLAEVARRADCGILLDINNLYVSAHNHGFDAAVYLASVPLERVGYIHLAGHEHCGEYLLDTHDRVVSDDVWALYRAAVRRFGAVSTLIEWDDALPSLPRVVEEAERARTEASYASREPLDA